MLEEENNEQESQLNNPAAEQQGALETNHTGKEIVDGARNEDQLDSLKEAVTDQEGASDGEEGQKEEGNATQTTGGSYAEEEENLGGTTNLSLEQLKNEGDAGD